VRGLSHARAYRRLGASRGVIALLWSLRRSTHGRRPVYERPGAEDQFGIGGSECPRHESNMRTRFRKRVRYALCCRGLPLPSRILGGCATRNGVIVRR
jgi:hypothetical protein